MMKEEPGLQTALAYQDTVARLEKDIAMIDAGAFYASAAISLKRIADALELSQHNTWQYRMESVAFNNFMDPHTSNNPTELGKAGWEVCAMWPSNLGTNMHAYIMYKRRLP